MAKPVSPLAPGLPAVTGIQDPAARRFAQAVRESIQAADSPQGALRSLERAASYITGGGSTPAAIAAWLFKSELYQSLTRDIVRIDLEAKQAILAEADARVAAIAAAVFEEAQARQDEIAAEVAARAAAVSAEADARAAGLLAEAQARSDAIATETQARIDGLAGEATARTQGLLDEAAARDAAVAAEASARMQAIQDEQGARAQALLDEAAARGTAITAEATLRQQGDDQLASQVTTLSATVDDNTAAIQSESTTRATADAALATRVDIVAAQADAVRSATAALIVSETTARADADSAMAQQITTLLATTDSNAAALQVEQTARVSGDEALAQQITLLSAGAGEQFDYAKIWYFDSGVESWTGNGTPTAPGGWLRPANHATDPYVDSPAGMAVGGTTHNQLRLRVRKFGSPAWEGYLWWRGPADSTWDAARRIALDETVYDANGIGVVTANTGWSGTIDRIRVDLSAAQTDTDRFEIDWVAVGRPAPGASTAALLSEQSARASADSAIATDLAALTATVTNNAATLTAAVTNEQTARAAGDSSLASQITSVSATANSKAVVFFQSTTPTATNINDMWVHTGEGNKFYRWNGSQWVAADDARISANAAAIVAEQTARADADSAEATAREALSAQMRGAYTGTDIAQVSSGLLYEERQARVTADSAQVASITVLQASVGDNAAAIVAEQTARADADSAMADDIAALTASVDTDVATLTGLISTEQTVRAAADTALSTRLDVVAAQADAVRSATAAMVVSETTSRADGDEALAEQIDLLSATVDTDRSNAAAALQTEATTRAAADAAEAASRETLATQLRGTYAGTDVAQVTTGLVFSERQARSTADAAEVTARQALSAKLTGQNDPASLTLATLASGLLFDERQARASEDSAQVTRIEGLEASVNSPTTGLATKATVAYVDTAVAGEASARAAAVSQLSADVAENAAAITTEATSRASEDDAIAQRLEIVAAQADAVRAATAAMVVNEVTARATEGEALAQQVTALGATVAENSALVLAEQTARATADTALASSIDGLQASVDANAATISAEATARASADAALTSQINTASSRLDTAEAAIVAEQTTRATSDDALMQAINTAWAITGATQAVIQSGGVLQTNWTAGQASKWSQLEAEVFSAGGKTIRAALAEESTVRANADGTLYAQWTLKTDINGYVSGFGFASTANNATPTSEFIVLADRFAVVTPGGTPIVPFIVDGTTTYISNAVIQKGEIFNLTVNNEIKSSNYAAGSAGWRLAKDGSFEANTGTFRGALAAATGTFGAVTVASNGHVKGGQTAYNTGVGFWLGIDGGTPKFSLGNPSGNFMKWDGANLLVNAITYVSPGGFALAAAMTERSSFAYVAPAKLKEIRVNATGSLHVNFDIRSGNTSTAYGYVYKNGSLVATLSTGSATYVTKQHQNLAVNQGDTVELWVMTSSANTTYIRNFWLGVNQSNQSVVNID